MQNAAQRVRDAGRVNPMDEDRGQERPRRVLNGENDILHPSRSTRHIAR